MAVKNITDGLLSVSMGRFPGLDVSNGKYEITSDGMLWLMDLAKQASLAVQKKIGEAPCR